MSAIFFNFFFSVMVQPRTTSYRPTYSTISGLIVIGTILYRAMEREDRAAQFNSDVYYPISSYMFVVSRASLSASVLEWIRKCEVNSYRKRVRTCPILIVNVREYNSPISSCLLERRSTSKHHDIIWSFFKINFTDTKLKVTHLQCPTFEVLA